MNGNDITLYCSSLVPMEVFRNKKNVIRRVTYVVTHVHLQALLNQIIQSSYIKYK